jgi:Zn-dependent peptidase ImmA (M78 family)
MAEVFSPERLRLARQRRGLFVQDLAALAGFSVRSVSSWENAGQVPTPENVAAVAKALNFPEAFFYAAGPPVLVGGVFRSAVRMTAAQRDTALAAGSMAIELDRWIHNNFQRPSPRVPDLRDATPEAAAEALRGEWGLGYQPVKNVVHTLEAHGVRIYSLVHDTPTVDAFSVWYDDSPYIFLNTMKTAERSRFDAAHELGHLTLHAHSDLAKKQAEKEAQAFASAFLMPKAQFLSVVPRYLTLANVIMAKQVWGVSAMAYVYRLHALGVIRDWQYRQLCIQVRTQHGSAEPGAERPRETSQVLGKVMGALGSNRITRTEIAAQLRVYPPDLDEITFGLVLTPVAGGQAKAPSQRPPNKGKLRLL